MATAAVAEKREFMHILIEQYQQILFYNIMCNM